GSIQVLLGPFPAWSWPCCPPSPALSSCRREGRAEGRGWRQITSPRPPHPRGEGHPSLQSWPQGHQSSRPQPNPQLWGTGGGPQGRAPASYVAGACPLASRPGIRLRGPSVGASPGLAAAPFFSGRCSGTASPSLESDSSTSLRTSFSI
ncbi:unnamed protein product, partial [Gulo gulo]